VNRIDYTWGNVAQYFVLVVAGATGLVEVYRSGSLWWAVGGLLALLAILYHLWPDRRYHQYLAAEMTLVASLTAFHPIFVILGFTLSAHAMILLPGRAGAFWVAVLMVITGGLLVRETGWFDGLLTTLGVGSGYASFGYAYYARGRAEVARRKSQALLEELEEAHSQLRTYAEQVGDLAGAEERNRLAREMHDTIGHRLTVAAVQLEGAQRLISSDPRRATQMVETVRSQVREALSDLRRTVTTLRTPLEVDVSLPHALTRLVNGFEEATNLNVHLVLPGDLPTLPDAHRSALYRAAQEALTNVQRHAQAQNVWLQLTCQPDSITLSVSDDGVGLPDEPGQSGLGLRGMRERAARLDGELTLASRPGGGTELTLHLPLSPEETDG
jgi:signal transduction histidine kinase